MKTVVSSSIRYPALCIIFTAISLLVPAVGRAAALSALSPYEAARPRPRHVGLTDSLIQDELQRRLSAEHGLNLSNVQFEVQNQNVVFRGRFDKMTDANRAVEIASAVRGVRGVDNFAEVAPAPRADLDVQRDVINALEHDATTRPLKIHAKISEGVVTLSGLVSEWQDKDAAEWVASGVAGVRSIRNQIQIVSGVQSDRELAKQIKRRLLADTSVSGDISVSVKAGVATLTGKVSSAVERDWATTDAWGPGIAEVNSDGLLIKSE